MKAQVSTASSNEATIRSTELDPVVTGTQLTTYEDAEARESVEVEDNASFLWRASDPLPHQGMQQVLSRSYKVAEFVWAESDVAESTLTTLSFPRVLFDIPQIANKLQWFGLFRCKGVQLSVRINSTMFHYGAIGMSHVTGVGGVGDPLFGTDHGIHTREFAQRMNNHVVILKAMTGETIEQKIPWELPVQWINPHYPALSGRDAIIGKVWFDAMTPLFAVATAILPVNVSVFANFIDPEVTAPLADTSAWPPPPPPQTQSAEEKEKTDLLTEVTDGVASVVTDFQRVVNMAAPIAESAMVLLDKPGTLQAPTITESKGGTNTYYGYGSSQYQRISLHPDAKTSVDTSLSTVGLKPSIREFVSVPGYFNSFNFDDSTAVGTEIVGYRVNPNEWSAVGAGLCPTYLSYVANLFEYWRGSIDYHFHFITSKFVTARVRISFKPMVEYNNTVGSHYPPDGPGGDIISKVVDISGDTHVSLRIPYISETLFKRVPARNATVVTKGNLDHSTGGVTVTLVNEIASQEAGQQIFCFVWISGGPDMQFNHYLGPNERLYLDVDPATIPEAQSAVRAFPELVEPIVDSQGVEVVGIADSEHFDDYVSLGKRMSIVFPSPTAQNMDCMPTLYPISGANLQTVGLQQYLAAPFRWIRGGSRLRYLAGARYATRQWELNQNDFRRYVETGAIATDSGIELPYYDRMPFMRTLAQRSYYINLELRDRLDTADGTSKSWWRAFSDDVGFSGLYSPPILRTTEPVPPPIPSTLMRKKKASRRPRDTDT